MDTHVIITAVVVACCLGGWYVVLAKYIEARTMLRERERKYNKQNHPEGYAFDAEYEKAIDHTLATTTADKKRSYNKREICNWAAIIHLSGFSIIFGIPLLNIVLPAALWLCSRQQHIYLAKQARQVINFQIMLSILYLVFLGAGAFIVWYLPEHAAKMFAVTKSLRVVFSSSMHLPFNMFTIWPFIWGCTMSLQGTLAAYRGLAFTYPLTPEFMPAPVKVKPKLSRNAVIEEEHDDDSDDSYDQDTSDDAQHGQVKYSFG